MPVAVYIDGHRIDRAGAVTDIKDSTIYRTPDLGGSSLGWSGDYLASCTLGVPYGFQAPWLHGGALYQHRLHGRVVFGGRLLEPVANPGDTTISLNAQGLGSDAVNRVAVNGAGNITLVANTAIDAARTGRGSLINRFGVSISSGPVPLVASGGAIMLDEVLDRVALPAGRRWWVDSDGAITLKADPTSALWALRPGLVYLGTTNEGAVTHLYGYVQSAAGPPATYGIITTSGSGLGDALALQQGRNEAIVDLTDMGVMSGPTAATELAGRYALVGGRMSVTSKIEIPFGAARRLGWGSCSPMGIRAGEMLRLPGTWDTRMQPTTRASMEVVLGQVDRDWKTQSVTATPVGYVGRDYMALVRKLVKNAA